MNSFANKRFKMAIIEPVGAYGGMEIYDLSILEGLLKYSDAVHLYTSVYFNRLTGVSFDNIKMVFGEIYSKDKSRLVRYLLFIVGLIRLSKSLLKNCYDIKYCHVFTYSLLELLIILTAKTGGGQIFVNIHDPEPFMNKSNRLIKKIFHKILTHKNCKVVTHSNYSKKILMRNFPGVTADVMPHTDLDYIYTPIKSSVIESMALLKLRSDRKYILFFGQIKRNKGLDILIKAFDESGISRKGYNLLIAGRCWGHDWSSYQKIIDDSYLSEDVVVFNGYIEPKLIYHYFNSSQFVVLPYTEIFSSGVLIRASGYGKPVICSDLPAFLEEVVDGDNGIVFEAGNSASLATALVTATLSLDTADMMSRKVVEKYSKKYDRYFVAEKMLKVFNL